MAEKAYSQFGPQELAPRPSNDNRPQTSMVERVARALAFVDGHGDFLPGSEATSWHEPARAAIEAMRRPTERMMYAADGMTDLVGPYPEANTPEERRQEFGIAWRVMIDAALVEHDKRRDA